MAEQKRLRQEDQEEMRREREERRQEQEAERQQREYEASRNALFRVRESAFNDHQAKENKKWVLTVNDDGSLDVKNLGAEIEEGVEFTVSDSERYRQSFMRLRRFGEGETATITLPNGLAEVDGIIIRAFRGVSYPEEEIVPIHPKHTMYEFRDPRSL